MDRTPLRDRLGRFAARPKTPQKGFGPSFGKPHSHAQCGKGQYKSFECKARSIRKAAIERGEATEREAPYIRWLYQYQDTEY